MISNNSEPIKIAILDLYNGEPNEGMRGLREVISSMNSIHEIAIEWKEFDVREAKNYPQQILICIFLRVDQETQLQMSTPDGKQHTSNG